MTKRRKHPVTDHIAESNAFLREVDDVMRVDRMTQLWLQYRMVFFIALGLTFSLFAAFKAYEQAREKNLQTQASTYWTFLDKGIAEDSVQTNFSELAEKGAVGYRLLAQFQIARGLIQDSKLNEAAKIYMQVAADDKTFPVYRQLARFYAAQIYMESKPDEAAALFSTLVEDNSAYKPISLEMLGNISENRGDMLMAKNYYDQVMSMSSVSQSLRARVQARLDVITRIMNQNS